MMRPCEKCFKNNWAFKVANDIVCAICDNCGHSVEFKAKIKNKLEKEKHEGDSCARRDKDCSGHLFWKDEGKINAKRLRKSYHYEKWLKCDECGAIFLDNKYKILHEIGPDGAIRFRHAC